MHQARLFLFLTFQVILTAGSTLAGQSQGTLLVEVRSQSQPVEQAEVQVGGMMAVTNARGEAALELPPGEVQVVVRRFGFASATARTTIRVGTTTRLAVELEAQSVLQEEIVVTATRTERRIQDEPLRVEVLDHEEIEEKTLMTPGDIAMLLNETSGLRVQVTAPSLGATNIRVQGLRGRYTQLLADGLPLYGGQTGAVGLLQIPPMDLGQVEVIKGVASALYGGSALGGVINLVSRRPQERERELLVNRTTRRGTDAALWLSTAAKQGWSYTFLGGGHVQNEADLDRDGWADLPGYRRLVIRPRAFWDDGKGRSFFGTVGVMAENREGGTLGGAVVPDGSPFPEELDTRRIDAGAVGRVLVGERLVMIRGSMMDQRHRHQFGDVVERDHHHTWFGEAGVTATSRGHTWVIGTAAQGDVYRSRDVSHLNYTYAVPALFAQNDFTPASWVTLSGSGRLDIHNEFGTFFNPRVSALVRLPRAWVARVSIGTGFFAPTPFTEETEAVGLTRVLPLTNVKAERARSASLDVSWHTAFLELNATAFGSVIDHAVELRAADRAGFLEIVNMDEPTRTVGSELLARLRHGQFGIVLSYTLIRSTEPDPDRGGRRDVPLTPRHTAGVVGMWEIEEQGRIGVEAFYTGQQTLDDNPYRRESHPYLFFGILAERRLGRVRLFVNGENLSNVRQTRYNPIVRPTRGFDGRWTVDAWAPLEGRVVNGGVRIEF